MFIDFYLFLLIFIDFYWFLLIFIGFLLISTDLRTFVAIYALFPQIFWNWKAQSRRLYRL